jgi:hypothetical protein
MRLRRLHAAADPVVPVHAAAGPIVPVAVVAAPAKALKSTITNRIRAIGRVGREAPADVPIMWTRTDMRFLYLVKKQEILRIVEDAHETLTKSAWNAVALGTMESLKKNALLLVPAETMATIWIASPPGTMMRTWIVVVLPETTATIDAAPPETTTIMTIVVNLVMGA